MRTKSFRSIGELFRELGADTRAQQERVRRAVIRAAERTLVHVKTVTVPVETGALRDSGRLEMRGNLPVVVFTAPYAVFVEIGTSRMRPRFYLRRALPFMARVLDEEIARALRGRGGR